jgi:hypothetical protein
VSAPSLAEVIRAFVREGAADLHVSIPAKVVRVELAKGLVDAQPLVKDLFEGQAVSVPVITNVPIVWPGAGGFRLTFPIAVGDTVLLVFSDRSLDLWLEKGGEVDPKDPRRHTLSDAIAIPGLRSFSAPWSGAAADGVTLGKDGGTYQPAALGQDVRDELDDLRTKFGSHTHAVTVTVDPSTHAGGGTAAATTATLAAAKTVKSATVKVSE